MKILKYIQIDNTDNFLKSLFSDNISESSEDILSNSFFDNLNIHKLLLNKYKDIIFLLDSITTILFNNSKIKIIDSKEKVIILSCMSALSVCELDDAQFLIDNDIIKSEYEVEIKSILEELKLSGIGNGFIKNLSEIFKSIFKLSEKIFKSKTLFDAFNEPNLLKSIINYIKIHKINLNTFISNIDIMIDTITNIYDKKGIKIKDKFINSNKHNKVSLINEFNL